MFIIVLACQGISWILISTALVCFRKLLRLCSSSNQIQILFNLQHQQAHKDKVAIGNTFHDVITHTDKSNKAVQSLKAHMIKPGFYYDHIQKWRQYYSDSQVCYISLSSFLNPLLLHFLPFKMMTRKNTPRAFYPLDYTKYQLGILVIKCLGGHLEYLSLNISV